MYKMTRVEEFLMEVSFTQLMDEKMARRIGFNSRTFGNALKNGLVSKDLSGYFFLTRSGRILLRRAENR